MSDLHDYHLLVNAADPGGQRRRQREKERRKREEKERRKREEEENR